MKMAVSGEAEGQQVENLRFTQQCNEQAQNAVVAGENLCFLRDQCCWHNRGSEEKVLLPCVSF